MKPIKEKTVEDAFVQTLNELVVGKERIMVNLDQSVQNIIQKTPLKDVKERQRQLQSAEDKLVELSKHSPQTSEDQIKTRELIEKASLLREEIVIAERLKGTHDILHQRVKEIRQVIRLPYLEYRGDIFRSLVEKVIVKDKKNLRFIFKCGIEMDCKTN